MRTALPAAATVVAVGTLGACSSIGGSDDSDVDFSCTAAGEARTIEIAEEISTVIRSSRPVSMKEHAFGDSGTRGKYEFPHEGGSDWRADLEAIRKEMSCTKVDVATIEDVTAGPYRCHATSGSFDLWAEAEVEIISFIPVA